VFAVKKGLDRAEEIQDIDAADQAVDWKGTSCFHDKMKGQPNVAPNRSHVNHSNRICDIDRGSWGALASATPLADYDWLATLEASHQAEHEACYWWIEDEQGVVAIVAALIFAADPLANEIDRQRYGFLAPVVRPLRRLLQNRPTLACGAQLAPGNPVLIREELDSEDRHIAASRLIDTIETYCRTHLLDLFFRAALDSDTGFQALLSGRRFIRFADLPNAVLDIRWNSWQAYLDHLKKEHSSTEKSVRMQVNRGRRDGVVIEELDDPSEYETDIHRILTEHYYRKNQSHLRIDPKFITRLKKSLEDRALIYVARKGDQVIGASVYLRNDTTLHWKLFGIAEDHIRSRNAVYFNLAFHQPIEQACTAGYERIVMGTVPYRVKISRGARLLPASNWIWQPNRLLGLLQRIPFAYAAWRQERNLEPFEEQAVI
jgi:predicted N-acyltransferase